MKICEKCKRVLEPFEKLAFFRKKEICSICFLRSKFPGPINKVLQEKIDWLIHRNQIKKEAFEQRKKMFKKRQAQKKLPKNKKIKVPRLSPEIKDRLQYLLHSGLTENGFCNLCGKELSGRRILWCSGICSSRFDAEKIKYKNFGE